VKITCFSHVVQELGWEKDSLRMDLIIEELITKKGLMGLTKNAIVNGKLVEH